jgi:hypothetical protein
VKSSRQDPFALLNADQLQAEIQNTRRCPMRYVKPCITGTYSANSVIQSRKGGLVRESETIAFTSGPAYQSEE